MFVRYYLFFLIGNRTPKQVSSRVQKYFIKLLRAGLPIPGRGPKMKLDVKKGMGHRHQRNNYSLFRRSTFFPHQDISFTIPDESKEQAITEESVCIATILYSSENLSFHYLLHYLYL